MGGLCGICEGLLGIGVTTKTIQRTVVHEEPWNMFEDPNADLLGNSIFGDPGPIPQENIVFERQSHEV